MNYVLDMGSTLPLLLPGTKREDCLLTVFPFLLFLFCPLQPVTPAPCTQLYVDIQNYTIKKERVLTLLPTPFDKYNPISRTPYTQVKLSKKQ